MTEIGEIYPKGTKFQVVSDGRIYIADGTYRRESDEIVYTG